MREALDEADEEREVIVELDTANECEDECEARDEYAEETLVMLPVVELEEAVVERMKVGVCV